MAMSMSSSEAARPNDPYAWIDRYAADLHQAARTLAREGEAARVSDEAVAQLLTAAIRLYVAKADGEERTFSPLIREDVEPMTATVNALDGPDDDLAWVQPGQRHAASFRIDCHLD